MDINEVEGLPIVLENMIKCALNDMTLLSQNMNGKRSLTCVNLNSM